MKNKWLIKNTINVFVGILIIIATPLDMYSQLNTGGEPNSFKKQLAKQIPVKVMPSIEISKLKKEDESDAKDGLPYRFGYGFEVEFNLKNSGSWIELDNGDRIWRLTIECPDARSINLTYDHFWLPKGAVLYIYSPDKSQVLGGFTMQNNKGQKKDKRGFATSLIKDEQIILEYYEPVNVAGEGVISINKVVHGYRTLNQDKNFGDSGDCHVNINCAEGANWQEEKRAVAIMVIDGVRVCTGALINNTCGNFDPLFLTADHCIQPYDYDATYNENGDDLMFLWDYESTGCNNPSVEPSFLTTTAATIIANGRIRFAYADFALLRLDEDPANLGNGFVPYYVGWDRTGILSSGGVGIHHPSSDIKKIATHSMIPTEQCGFPFGTFDTRWLEVYWDATPNGHSITEPGSSGSPLFDNNHRVLGQLYGNSGCSITSDNCANPVEDEAVYGAISWSWDSDGATDSRRRLRDWLDPCNTTVTILDGIAFNDNCVADLTHSGIITSGLYQAANSITSTATIGNNQYVTYDAGNFISLNPNFEADADNGSFFLAHIDGCDDSMLGLIEESSQDGEEKTETINTGEVAVKNYPNPFTGHTTIEFTLQSDSPVTVFVSDVTGREVVTLLNNEQQTEGTHQVTFDGNAYPSGMYYYTIQAGQYIGTQKMTLIK